MAEIKIYFTQYTLQELLDCRENIDTEQYPDRAREVDLLIKDRSQQRNQNSNQESATEENDDAFGFSSRFSRPSIKGFLPNLAVGVSEIVLGIIIWIAFEEFGSEISGTNEDTWMFVAFASLSSAVSGIYHIYKSFREKQVSIENEQSKNAYKNRRDKSKTNNSVVKRSS